VYFVLGWIIVLACMELMGREIVAFSWYIGKMTTALGFSLIIAGLLIGGPSIQTVFRFGPLRLIGLVGYSAYLWHMPVIYLILQIPYIRSLEPAQRFPQVLLRASLTVLALSVFFFLFVEKPFLVYGRRDRSDQRLPATLDAETVPDPYFAAEAAPAGTSEAKGW
jgi:peptidoglycan/LPS O-acetylase OafA/YrhL